VSTCPSCNWENDADAGACAGCGADLGGGAAAVPPPRFAEDEAPAPAPIVREQTAPVPIRPQTSAPRTIDPVRGDPRYVELDRTPRPAENVSRTQAPIRDIPVVVAPSAARPAVRGRQEWDAGATGFPAPSGGPGTRMCPSCGASVEAGRSFCRCGAQLSRTTATREDPSAVLAQGWSRPVFRRAQRAANGGRRVRYDAPRAVRVYVFRVAAVLLLLALLGSQAPPWGPDVRSWVQTRVEQVLPG
jgi:hypothetical protein